jgi:hypothetical protein
MANSNIDIAKVNELEPQIIFDELQDAFDELFHDYKKKTKLHKKTFFYKIN